MYHVSERILHIDDANSPQPSGSPRVEIQRAGYSAVLSGVIAVSVATWNFL
jgi:hypothetical protein